MAKAPNTTTAPTGQIAPFGLRMLPELKERLEVAAKATGRSMNAEIVARLQQSFDGGGDKDARDKLMVAGFVLRMIQNTVPDAAVQEDIATMAKYLSDTSEDDQPLTAFEAVTRLQKRHQSKSFAGLKR